MVAQLAEVVMWGQPPSAVRRAKLDDFSVPAGKLNDLPAFSPLVRPCGRIGNSGAACDQYLYRCLDSLERNSCNLAASSSDACSTADLLRAVACRANQITTAIIPHQPRSRTTAAIVVS